MAFQDKQYDFVYDRNIRHRHTDKSFYPRTNDTVLSNPVYGRNIGRSNTNRHCIKIDPYAAVLLGHSVLCYNVSINTGLYNVKIQSYVQIYFIGVTVRISVPNVTAVYRSVPFALGS